MICDTFVHIIAANECQIRGKGKDDWECCRGMDSQRHHYCTPNRVNSTQTERGAGMDGFEWVWRTVWLTLSQLLARSRDCSEHRAKSKERKWRT